MSRPLLTVALPSFGQSPPGGWRHLPELARLAEEAGVDRVVVSDHVVMGRHTERYQWGRFPVPPEAPWMEPLTVLTAMAAVTERIRLSTGILIAPLRPAALLAKTVATLDQLSGGRLDLGVGTGWQQEEYHAEGLDFSRRARLLTETVAACRVLWTKNPAAYEGEEVSFHTIYCEPKPLQDPLPVWFSGTLVPANVARIVELGDGWIPIMGATNEEIEKGVELLSGRLQAAGRDPKTLRVQAPPELHRRDDGSVDLAATMGSISALSAIGVTDIQVNLALVAKEEPEPAAGLRRLVEEFTSVVGS